MKYLLLSMRPHQWTKNLFIFLPLIFGQQLFNFEAFLKTFFMFFLFTLAASAIYLINDIVDLENDKKHYEKCLRPLASGKITIFQAKVFAIIFGSMSIILSILLDTYAGLTIIIYIALNYLYMKVLKNAVIIDVFCIGAFFYFRILAGSITTDVVLSNWIILCTVLIALFLAFNKRRYDLKVSKNNSLIYTKYSRYFIDRMISIISSSIVIAYTLYAMDANTIARFGTNHLIYTVPFVYYGLFRYLYLVDRKGSGGDPARILLKDFKTSLNLVLWIIMCVVVIYFNL